MRPYCTVSSQARVDQLINKSRFIGRCAPAGTEEEALAFLEGIRRAHRDASHNCYAYSIGPEGGAARFSDDGEPGGTAGLPMMEAIRHKGVTDIVVVVTRYFGGVLLGAGGLLRAYSKAASEAIDAAGPVMMRPCLRYTLTCDYNRWGALEMTLKQYGSIEETEYSDKVTAGALIVEADAAAFERAVSERTDGRVNPGVGEAVYGAFPINHCSSACTR